MSLQSLKFKRTKLAVLLSGFLTEPLMLTYFLLPFILRKNLNASVYHLSTLFSLKYVLAAFCLYWVSPIYSRHDKLKSNLFWAGLFMRLPFFLLPWVQNPWLFVLLAAIHKLFYKASTPAWIEILKINLPEKHRSSLFAYGATLAYGAGVLLLPFMGMWMDISGDSWRWLFPCVAFISLFALYFQLIIPLDVGKQLIETPSYHPKSVKDFLWNPWLKIIELLKKQKEFAYFHIGYMICGVGVLALQPLVPILCADTLQLHYWEYALALGLFKGMGLTLTSPFWGRYFQRVSIFYFSGLISLIMGFFGLILLLSIFAGSQWIYFAHFIYGVALAGDHISWNLSAASFAKESHSAIYSSTNVLLLSLRACIAPFLGGLLHHYIGSAFVIFLSIACCSFSAYWMFRKERLPTFAT